MSITIKNSRIVNYYKANPSQNIERNNLFLIELIENIKDSIEKGINTNETIQYLDSFKTLVDTNFRDLESQVRENNVANEIKALDAKIQLLNKDTEQLTEIKTMVNSHKYSVTKEIETLMKSTENSNIINFGEIIDKKHELIVGKISSELSKDSKDNSKSLSATLSNQLQERFNDIKKETDKIINSDSSNNIKVIESYFNKLNEAFNLSEAKNESDRKNSIEQQQLVSKTQTDLLYEKISSSFRPSLEKLDQYIDLQTTTNSSRKGNVSEGKLEIVLNKCFPNSTIENTSKTGQSGDFLIKYKSSVIENAHADSDGYISIMIENKNYKGNVPEEEVKKFIDDVKTTNNHGIFLSQTSGIATKNNYDIDFEGKNVLLYLHNVQYDENTIISAVKLLEAILSKINLKNPGQNIPEEKIKAVRREITEFFEIKNCLIQDSNTIIDSIKRNLVANIERLKFPNLSAMVNVASSTKSGDHACEFCGLTFPTKQALGGHKKKHRDEMNATKGTKTNSIINVKT